MSGPAASPPLLRRVAARTGRRVALTFDGAAVEAHEGESVMTALLCAGAKVRRFEFAPADRAGFCLMGACQDCWLWREDGARVRACGETVREGMRLFSAPPDAPFSGDAPSSEDPA